MRLPRVGTAPLRRLPQRVQNGEERRLRPKLRIKQQRPLRQAVRPRVLFKPCAVVPAIWIADAPRHQRTDRRLIKRNRQKARINIRDCMVASRNVRWASTVVDIQFSDQYLQPPAGDLSQKLLVNLLVEIAKLPVFQVRLQAHSIDGRIGLLQPIQQA